MKTVNGEETVYTYNALNQLVSENDIVYEYDLNGNTVRMTSPDKSALYVYNAENRLIRATVQSGNNVSVEEYEYDYAGNRVAKSTEGEYIKYLLDTNSELTYVLAEMNYDGTERCFYTRGDELISQEREGKKSYYVYDGHGSVRALADDSGKVRYYCKIWHEQTNYPLQIIKGAGHNANVDNPEEMNCIINEFIEEKVLCS